MKLEDSATSALLVLEERLEAKIERYRERDRLPLPSDLDKLERVYRELDKRGV